MAEHTMRLKAATHLAFEDGSARRSTSCPENGSISESDPSSNSPESGEHVEATIDEEKSDSSLVGAFQKDGRNRSVMAAEYPDSDTENPTLAPLAPGFLSGSGDARFPTALELCGENPDIDDANPLAARLFPCAPVETPACERRIEDPAMGDPVHHPDEKAVRATRAGRQASGRKRSVQAKWIGRKTVSTRFNLSERVMPTRYAYGGPGRGMLHSEATVAVCRAMFLAGVIRGATAAAGAATTRVPPSEFGESFALRSVEAEAREIVLADGGPPENFVGNFSRRAVDSRAGFQTLHGHLPETRDPSLPRAYGARHPPTHIGAGLGNGANADSAG